MRVRLRFSKIGKVRWTSHRDVARMWERALRRTGLPMAYTEGFTPRPKLSFGLALPTGHESFAEYLDAELAAESFDVASLPARLSPALPVGIDVTAAAAVEGRAGSLQEEVSSTTWELEVTGVAEPQLQSLVAAALAAEAIVINRERKGRVDAGDVRPSIISVAVTPPPRRGGDDEPDAANSWLLCELATRPRGLRPAELLAALSPELVQGRGRRLQQWIERDGARREPLPIEATDAPHACERAS